MISMFRNLAKIRVLERSGLAFGFSREKEEIYIPMRTLKEDRNVLFNAGNPNSISLMNKALIYTPFYAITLDGFINEWNNWRIAGSVISLWLGLRVINYINFGRAHQIYTLKVSKNLSKFYLTVPSNKYSSQIEKMLLERQGKSFEQKFKEELKKRTLEIPDEIYNQLNEASDTQLDNHIAFLRRVRNGVILELNRSEIEKIEFISQTQMRKVISQNMLTEILSRKKSPSILQEYSATKQKKNFILLTTKPFKKWNNNAIHFFLNFENNIDKKHEEYLKALAEGKKIVDL